MVSQNFPIVVIVCIISALYLISCANSSNQPRLKHIVAEKSLREDDLKPVSIAGLASGTTDPPTPEEANRRLQQLGHDWFYGGGFGRTALNIGTVVFFPPYAIYLVGNACLQLADKEPIYITDALPKAPRERVLRAYNEVTSVPGRFAAGVSGNDFVESK